MANGYSQVFTLSRLLGNKELKKVLPTISYKESFKNGKQSQRTSVESIPQMIYRIVLPVQGLYDTFKSDLKGCTITLDGTSMFDIDTLQNNVYNLIISSKHKIVFGVNNIDILRYALKESNKVEDINAKFKDTKLYLKATTVQQIKRLAFDKKGLKELMTDLMANIYFSDKFKETQKKFGLDQYSAFGKSYEQLKAQWQRKVGEI